MSTHDLPAPSAETPAASPDRPAATLGKPAAARRGLRFALVALFRMTLSRTAWNVTTVLLGFPLVFLLILTTARDFSAMPAEKAFRDFNRQVTTGLFLPIALPLIALAYGSTVLGREREDRTLVFLLVRPIPRPLMLLTQFAAALVCTEAVALSFLWILGAAAGPEGVRSATLASPAVALTAAAYTALFLLISVMFRHAAVWSLLYAFFVELFLGNMPGIIKQISLNFYGRSLIFAAGKPHGLTPAPQRELFQPVSAEWAYLILPSAAAVLLLLAVVDFSRREYRDLS